MAIVIQRPNPDLLVSKYRVVCSNLRCQALIEFTANELVGYDSDCIKCPACSTLTNQTSKAVKVNSVDLHIDASCKRITTHKNGTVLYFSVTDRGIVATGPDLVEKNLVDSLKFLGVSSDRLADVCNIFYLLLQEKSPLQSKDV